tara:strand:- start:26903 stop:27343 length:441 start_codon:yes stop_codon:yes gene_type:complete
MDIRKVKKLIEMLESSNLEEIEIQEGEESVRLVKRKNSHVNLQEVSQPIEVQSTQKIEKDEPSIEEQTVGNAIKSPMVGTFYASPSPGAREFAKAGDIIKEGDVVCIVEAMKMMNEIKSEFSGKILKVHTDNASPVEFGQTLFTIE